MGQLLMRSIALLWCAVLMSAVLTVQVAFGARSCSVLLSSNRGLTACQALPKLGATLAWTIHNASNSVDFAFSGSASASEGWVGWGINPTAQAMVGTQTLIAFKSSSGAPVVHTYAITGPMKGGAAAFVPGNLTLNFTKVSAEITTGTEMTIFATLNRQLLQPSSSSNESSSWSMNHVWNQGASVELATNAIGPHSFEGDSLLSVAAIDLATNVASSNIDLPHHKLKNRHGIISGVAWGLLLPLGVMSARYLRPLSGSNSAWFYIHIACQCTGYTLGVVAWAMGLQLHAYVVEEGGAVPTKHRNIGLTIFTFASLQMLALWLRPKPDAKYRKHWNVYHHGIGYITIILIIVNIFEGLDVLLPGDKWTNSYIVVLTVLGGTSFVMEIVIWTLWLRRRAKKNAGTLQQNPINHRSAAAPGGKVHRTERELKKPMDAV